MCANRRTRPRAGGNMGPMNNGAKSGSTRQGRGSAVQQRMLRGLVPARVAGASRLGRRVVGRVGGQVRGVASRAHQGSGVGLVAKARGVTIVLGHAGRECMLGLVLVAR